MSTHWMGHTDQPRYPGEGVPRWKVGTHWLEDKYYRCGQLDTVSWYSALRLPSTPVHGRIWMFNNCMELPFEEWNNFSLVVSFCLPIGLQVKSDANGSYDAIYRFGKGWVRVLEDFLVSGLLGFRIFKWTISIIQCSDVLFLWSATWVRGDMASFAGPKYQCFLWRLTSLGGNNNMLEIFS